MPSPKDEEQAVNAVARAGRIGDALRRERALSAIRAVRHPVSAEPGTVLPGLVSGPQFDEVAGVVQAMLADAECFVLVGLAGEHAAATRALERVVAEGFVSGVACSGGLLVGGLPQGAEAAVEEALAGWPEGRVLSSAALCAALGPLASPDALLGLAAGSGLPVVVPALADSALGSAVSLHNVTRRRKGLRGIVVDPLLDLEDLAGRLSGVAALGLLTVGGGAPRGFAEQVAPYLGRRHERLGEGPPPKARYDVRVGPDTFVALMERALA